MQVRAAYAVHEQLCSLGAHVAHVDIHDRELRAGEAGEGVVVKGQDAHVRGDAQAQLLQRGDAAEGDEVICADDGVRGGLGWHQAQRHTPALRPCALAQPDIALGQLPSGALQALAHALQPVWGDHVVLAAADEGYACIALVHEVCGGGHAGKDVVYVYPADLALEIGQAQDDVREARSRQQRGQRPAHDRGVDGQAVAAAAVYELLRRLAGRGRVRGAELKPIAPRAQGFLHAREYLEQVRVFKGRVRTQVGKENDGLRRAAREALGAGAGIIAQLAHDGAHPLRSLLRDAVMPVYDLGHRGHGGPGLAGHVLYSHRQALTPSKP